MFNMSSRVRTARPTRSSSLICSSVSCRATVPAQATLLYGTPEEVIAERARQTKAHYIVFGMHKDGDF